MTEGEHSRFVARLQRLTGNRFWQVWRGAGSHLFFDTGEPVITFSERTTKRSKVGGFAVERRSVQVAGSQTLHIEMAT